MISFCVCGATRKEWKKVEVAQSGQRDEGEMEKTVRDEKVHCA
jgi:hypothetical protein